RPPPARAARGGPPPYPTPPGRGRSQRAGTLGPYSLSRSCQTGTVSGSGTSGMGASWYSGPRSATWNDADRAKIARPCGAATARRGGEEGVGGQGVPQPVGRDGPSGGHQGLAGHLAAEDPLEILVRAAAPEDVLLDLLEVEDLLQHVQAG